MKNLTTFINFVQK